MPAVSNICCNSLRSRALFAMNTTLIISIFMSLLTIMENRSPFHKNPVPEFDYIWPILSAINLLASFSSIVEIYKSDVVLHLSNPNPWLSFFVMTQILNFMVGLFFMFEILRRIAVIKYCQYVLDCLSKFILSIDEVEKLQQVLVDSALLVGFIFWFTTAAFIILFLIFALMARDYQIDLQNRMRAEFNDSDIPLEEVRPLQRTEFSLSTLVRPYYDTIQQR